MRNLFCIVLVACGGNLDSADSASSSSSDAPAMADAGLGALSCRELVDQARALVATLDTTCGGVGDCVLVGYRDTCNGGPSLSQGSGYALSATGAASAELQALEHEYDSRCLQCGGGDNPCSVDAAPALLACDSGHCTATARSCLPAPHDAGN